MRIHYGYFDTVVFVAEGDDLQAAFDAVDGNGLIYVQSGTYQAVAPIRTNDHDR